MAIKIGNIDATYKVGGNDCSIYLGNTLLYPTTPPSFDGKWKATYQDSSVTTAACDSTSAISQNEITLQDLVSVEVGNCVTTISGYAFTLCTSLTSVTLPNSVTSIGERAFQYCSGLTSVTIPNSVTNIGSYAFVNCSSLTSCTIGSGVTNIDGYAFAGCTNLQSITVNAIVPPSPNEETSNWHAFDNTNDCPIYVPCESVSAYKSASGWWSYASRIRCATSNNRFSAEYSDGRSYSEACYDDTTLGTSTTKPSGYEYSSMTSCIIGSCITNISDYAFNQCTSLTSVTIGNSVTTIGVQAFVNCSSLTNVTLPNSVTSINRGVFKNCNNISSVTIEAVVPPSMPSSSLSSYSPFPNNYPIYVPDESVNTYKTTSGWWSKYASRIQAIPNS